MKTRKRILSLSLALLLCAGLLSGAALAEPEEDPADQEDITAGEFGDLYWELDVYEQLLWISGDGYMPGPPAENFPWYGHREEIACLMIDEGVRSIADCAMTDCANLTEVTLPQSLGYIGEGAFAGCDDLSFVGYYGTADEWAEIVIADGNEALLALEPVFLDPLPNDWSYDVTDDETAVIMHYGGEDIDVVIPEELDGFPVTGIKEDAFRYCDTVETVTIHAGVTEIAADAFPDCERLREFIVAEENPAYAAADGVLYTKDGTALIRCPCAREDSLAVPEGVTDILTGAFRACAALKEVTLPAGAAAIGAYAFDGCKTLETVNLPEGLAVIAECAFLNCESLQEADLPSTALTLESRAFCGCAALKSVVIPEGIVSLSEGLLSYCTGLESVTLPKTLERIETEALDACWRLRRIDLPEGLNYIGPRAFQDTGLERVEIPAGVTVIMGETFTSCGNLREVVLPDTLERITVRAFWSCEELTDIRIPASVIYIDSTAFWYCPKLTSFDLDPENACYRTEDGVLYSKDGKELVCCPTGKTGRLTIPEGVKTIRSYAFSSSMLEEVTIPESVTRLDAGAFSGCELKKLTVPSGVTFLGDYVFGSCYYLEEVLFLGSAPQMFRDTFHNTTTTIRYYPFLEGWEEAAAGYYDGDLTWEPVDCGALEALEVAAPPARTSYGQKDKPDLTGLVLNAVFEKETVTLRPWLLPEPEYDFSVPGDTVITLRLLDKSVDIPVTAADYYAAGTAGALTWLLSADGVLTISGEGEMTETPWDYCANSILSVELGPGVTTICEYAFARCSAMTSFTVPAGVTGIGSGAFCRYGALESVTVEPGNTAYCDVDGVLFTADMSSLILYPEGQEALTYEVPAGVKTIEDYAFTASSLTAVTLPEGLTDIGYNAFYDCVFLEYIVLPASLQSTDSSFVCCWSLTDVYYGGSEEDWAAVRIEVDPDGYGDALETAAIHCLSAGPAEGPAEAAPVSAAQILRDGGGAADALDAALLLRDAVGL